MAVRIPYELVSHTRKIGNLYKRWVRNLQVVHILRHEFRFEATVARARFDKLLNEKDMIKAKQMMEDMEEELFHKLHPQQLYFATSPGGVAYDRYADPPDYVLDAWHPMEKSLYPKYFARRELRKQQYIEMWEKMYGSKPENEEKK